MLNQLIGRFTLIMSLLFLATTFQPAVAAVTDTLADSVIEKVNINSASIEQLSSIKGIGVKKAQAIIDYRKNNGKFKKIEDLSEVKGIGTSTLQKIAPYLSL